MAPPDYTGQCKISQYNNINNTDDRQYLTNLKDRAATIPLNIGGRFVWKITKADNSPYYILILMPSGSTTPFIPLPTKPVVLTLGEGVGGMEEMSIMVEPMSAVPSKNQLWQLTDVPDKECLPDTLMGRIHPAEAPEFSAATVIGTAKTPNPENYVYAVPKQWPNEERLWTFEYIKENKGE